ncbi:hypothetical protein [Kribbella flavida]|uniref:hypothetical protein n=1 Tax=Kribbella flavida TaxID=182640 RepID=UPI00019BF67F|nr:hypothetical protein [Kribbella flavida]
MIVIYVDADMEITEPVTPTRSTTWPTGCLTTAGSGRSTTSLSVQPSSVPGWGSRLIFQVDLLSRQERWTESSRTLRREVVSFIVVL